MVYRQKFPELSKLQVKILIVFVYHTFWDVNICFLIILYRESAAKRDGEDI